MNFSTLWLLLFAAGLVVEGVALYMKATGDTLSEQVWSLRGLRLGRTVLFPAWAWITLHWFVEPASMSPAAGVWWDDWMVIVIAVVLAQFVNYGGRENEKKGAVGDGDEQV